MSGVLIAGGFVLLYTERVRHRDRESRNDHAQFNVGDSFDMSGGRRAIPNKRREIADDEASGADGDGD